MVRHKYYNEEKTLVKSYSDKGYKLIQQGTNNIYDEAIDVFSYVDLEGIPHGRYEYKESDEKIEPQYKTEELERG